MCESDAAARDNFSHLDSLNRIERLWDGRPKGVSAPIAANNLRQIGVTLLFEMLNFTLLPGDDRPLVL